MNRSSHPPRLRAVTLWAASTLALTGLVRWVIDDIGSTSTPLTFDEALVRVCLAATVICALWAWVVIGAVVVEVLRRSTQRTPGVPAWARALVLMTCGVAAVGLAAPAGATNDVDLDGLPMPDRATAGFLATTVRPALQAAPSPHPDINPSIHRVAPGESLWSIAEGELGDPARWNEIFDLNRERIGADPDFIEIDQRLHLPHR